MSKSEGKDALTEKQIAEGLRILKIPAAEAAAWLSNVAVNPLPLPLPTEEKATDVVIATSTDSDGGGWDNGGLERHTP
jgi:hypothetical protein